LEARDTKFTRGQKIKTIVNRIESGHITSVLIKNQNGAFTVKSI
jgi:hypothetical protein